MGFQINIKIIACIIGLIHLTYFSLDNQVKADTNPTCPTLKQQPFKLTKIAKDTYVRKGVHQIFTPQNLAAIANIGFIVGKNSIAVIDTGGSHCDGKRFLSAIREISKKPIAYVINTHAHPDHTFGNQAFKAENPVFVGHEKLPRALSDKGPLYLNNLKRLVGEQAMADTKIILPTKTVSDTMKIDLGNKQLILKAYQTAHTDHDLSVFDPSTKIIWAGDLLFAEHTPVIDGSLVGWQKVMNQLAKIPAKYVVPGHGGPLLEWPKALAPQRAYLQTLTKDLRSIIQKGGTMLEAQSGAGHSQKKGWLLFDQFNPRNASTGFAELEWE